MAFGTVLSELRNIVELLIVMVSWWCEVMYPEVLQVHRDAAVLSNGGESCFPLVRIRDLLANPTAPSYHLLLLHVKMLSFSDRPTPVQHYKQSAECMLEILTRNPQRSHYIAWYYQFHPTRECR